MLSNFEKGCAFEAQMAMETDPDMRARCRKRADQYFGLALKESKLEIQQKKPHYAFGRILVPVGISAAVLFLLVLGAKYLMPTVSLLELSAAAGLLLIVIALVVGFTRGKADSQALVSTVNVLSGNLSKLSSKSSSEMLDSGSSSNAPGK